MRYPMVWTARAALVLVSAAFAATAVAQTPTASRDSIAVRAMRDELARTMAELRLEKADRPYFVAYTMTETDGSSASATAGSLLGANQYRNRILHVEVRVGDYTFDNSNFAGGPPTSAAGILAALGIAELPLDDDYLEIRRQAWLATDAAYKGAVEAIAGKRAALLNRSRSDSLADFARADITRTVDEQPAISFDSEAAKTLVRDLSRDGSLPGIYDSNVALRGSNARIYYVNSEGTSYVRSRSLLTLSADASTQAADGMALRTSMQISAPSFAKLPTRDQLTARVRRVYAQLDTLRRAAVIDRYNGPVLFEGDAAAELFSDQFGSALTASRKPVSGNDQNEMFAAIMSGSAGRGASLSEKLGARILPDFLNVTDDPTRREYDGTILLGSYTVDDQGVRAQKTFVIEKGILKTLLSNRTPTEGATRSSGNARGSGVAVSNLIVEATNGLTDAAMRERLIASAKARGLPFALVVRTVGSGGDGNDPSSLIAEMMAATRPGAAERGRNLLRVYKVFADGREECVRGAQLLGLTAESFKNMVAASSTASVVRRAGAGGLAAFAQMESGTTALSTFVVPSLLFDDLTITKRSDPGAKPPISEPPVPR
jgi:TldD protein